MMINTYLRSTIHAGPLAVFRILFGLLMTASIIRFWSRGWIEKLYLKPDFHFHYMGFEWVSVPSDLWCYVLFAVCGLSALFVALGRWYRLSIIVFFLSFTYIELMDKTTYLNHYYFISVVSLLLIFLPAGKYFSVDAWQDPSRSVEYIPAWNVDILKLLLCLVYFYAGTAKLNADWLLHAMPLSLWLPAKNQIPLISQWMGERWMHYAFSWAGALYDLCIPFLLMMRKTRKYAFIVVIVFHVLTSILFPIGMFPYIMIFSALIFFGPSFHERLLEYLSRLLGGVKSRFDNGQKLLFGRAGRNRWSFGVVLLILFLQFLIPLRSIAYSGPIFWKEEGYRYSWRVMLMEKTGYAQFKVVDKVTGKWFYVRNEDFLTAFQQKQMSTQADFIIEYAHYLADHFRKDGHKNIAIYVDSVVALNGRPSQTFIDPEVDLLTLENNLKPRDFIIDLHE